MKFGRNQLPSPKTRFSTGTSFWPISNSLRRPGIAFVTRGPGASNAAIGVHTAAQDSTPMIVFVGQVGGDFADREAFQEIDYRRMYGQMAKWVAQVDRAERIPEYVSHAFHTAMAGRPGPVVLALPEDALFAEAAVADAPLSTRVYLSRRLVCLMRVLDRGPRYLKYASESWKRSMRTRVSPG